MLLENPDNPAIQVTMVRRGSLVPLALPVMTALQDQQVPKVLQAIQVNPEKLDTLVFQAQLVRKAQLVPKVLEDTTGKLEPLENPAQLEHLENPVPLDTLGRPVMMENLEKLVLQVPKEKEVILVPLGSLVPQALRDLLDTMVKLERLVRQESQESQGKMVRLVTLVLLAPLVLKGKKATMVFPDLPVLLVKLALLETMENPV